MRRIITLLMALCAIAVMVAGSACTSITELLSPGFVVSDLSVTPNPAEIGQTITVTATVTNTGDAAGVFYAPLLVDGQAVGVETVTLEAGAEQALEYSYVATFGGSYDFVLGTETVTVEVIASTMQNILKMVPADWNAFLYFGAGTMRADTATAPDKGMADLWAIAEDYLDYFAELVELDTAAYPTGDLPFTPAQADYIAFGIGGLETIDFSEEGALPNMTLMIGGSFTATQVGGFLNNFSTNWPEANFSFTAGTYGGEDIWEVTFDGDGPDLSIAVIEGSTIILFGPTADVQDCIDTINGAGDADSMFENDNIRDIMGDFGNPVMMVVADGNIPLPEGGGGDGPTLPDVMEMTAGIAMEKVGDTMRMKVIVEVGEMGNWLALLTEAIPTPEEFEDIMEENRLREERLDEYWRVQEAVNYMMGDNWMPNGALPNPLSEAGGVATNDMSAFPDPTSEAGTADKQWDHNGDPYTTNDKDGYLLRQHDGMATDDAEDLWWYIDQELSTTQYYYTCEPYGFVRQWSDASLTEEYTEGRVIEEYYERLQSEEYWTVQQAVYALMDDNGIWDFQDYWSPVGVATNDMSAFPDPTTEAGSTYKLQDRWETTFQAGDKDGYTVYQHDGIADNSAVELWDYIWLPTTQYYYTCESDGFVHQYSDPGMTEEITPDRDWGW